MKWPRNRKRMMMFRSVGHYLAMIRFSHTLFALPFALLAAVMAWTTPLPEGQAPDFQWRDLLGIVLCMTFARSAAMAFNRLADRKIDAENPRTRMRHLPAGILTTGGVAAFTAVCSIAFFLATLLFMPNVLPAILAIPVLAFLFAYSYTKRFTSLAHFWLGTALMLAPVSAWIALRGETLLSAPGDLAPALLLGAAVLLWVSGFDIIYACQDVEFDKKLRLRSVPARLGTPGALRVAAICHLGMLAMLIALPLACPQVPLGWIYWTAVIAVAALLTYEHALVRPDDLTRVNVAFFHVNAVVSIGLFLVGTIDLLW
jgi:4-hydroxybenzoate polyprenyltransferase